ncbi:MAG: isopentenyl-diphosphate Delta-isomerase [Proteobacteria bacterium]|nr:isopentenyl-diphosphate Delta-isomerase [Pseudomonadota bacterium]
MNTQVSFDDDLLILVDESGQEIGSKEKLQCHMGSGVLHRAFSVFIINSESEVLLQKRSEDKLLWPMYWSNSCCSHPRYGEEEYDAARRRLLEELGIRATELTKHFQFQYIANYGDIGTEHELCSVFTGHTEDEISANPNEIADWKWVAKSELSELLIAEKEHFTPWINLAWKELKKVIC